MRRLRFQFRLSTLLWITLAVACWFGGSGWQRHQWEREQREMFSRLFQAVGNPQKLRRRGFVDELYQAP
jgi:hypothetical protein